MLFHPHYTKRRKEERAYEESMRSLNRTIDNLKANQAQLERQISSLESDRIQLQQATLTKAQDQEQQLKLGSERIQELLRETQDLQTKLQQEERQHGTQRHVIDTLRHKAAAFVQVYDITTVANVNDDVVQYIQEIFSWFSKTFNTLQDEVHMLGTTHSEQEVYWKRRIASLEETVLQTSASWKEAQAKLEQSEKKGHEQAAEIQSLQLLVQKRDFTIQELNLQVDASRKDYQHLVDLHSQLDKQLAEEKQKVKVSENMLKLSKDKEAHAQEDLAQTRQQMAQIEASRALVEEQLQSLQRLYQQLEDQSKESEAKSLQQMKELGQERMKVTDGQRQLELAQRRRDSLEQELEQTKKYWEERWQSYANKASDDEVCSLTVAFLDDEESCLIVLLRTVDALERSASAIRTGLTTSPGEVYSFGRESEQFPTRFRTMPIGEANAAKAGMVVKAEGCHG